MGLRVRQNTFNRFLSEKYPSSVPLTLQTFENTKLHEYRHGQPARLNRSERDLHLPLTGLLLHRVDNHWASSCINEWCVVRRNSMNPVKIYHSAVLKGNISLALRVFIFRQISTWKMRDTILFFSFFFFSFLSRTSSETLFTKTETLLTSLEHKMKHALLSSLTVLAVACLMATPVQGVDEACVTECTNKITPEREACDKAGGKPCNSDAYSKGLKCYGECVNNKKS